MKQKLISLAAAAALILWFSLSLSSLRRGQQAQALGQLENAIRRSAVACYAAEGVYPPDLAYLQQHYGLQIDSGRYLVHYEIFADNLMPQITVLER